MAEVTYLDYMATTPLDPRIVSPMLQCLTLDGDFANPGSTSHQLGLRAKARTEQAREQVAALINASAAEIVWTSGATEANNLAIKGAANFHQHKGKHLITCQSEHKSVIESCEALEQQGFSVTYLQPNAQGLINLEQLQAAIRPDTILVSIMFVNNETGVIQDIQSIADTLAQRDILLHVDAAQAAGKIEIDLQKMPIDLLSLSAHKIYGPKGIGALYVRRKPRVRIKPLLHGGGQEMGLRAGTLPTAQVVAMGMAFELAKQEMAAEQARLKKLSDKMWQTLQKNCPQIELNASEAPRVAGVLNICFHLVAGEALMTALPELAFSNGSACNSVVNESSYVLRAMGLSEMSAASSIRLCCGRFTTEQQIEQAAEQISQAVAQLRGLSPLWEKTQSVNIAQAEQKLNSFAVEVGAAERGMVLRLQFQLNDATLIEEVDYKVHGCGHMMSTAAFVAEKLKGQTLSEAEMFGAQQISEQLALPSNKYYCAVLAEDAIKSLVNKIDGGTNE